MIRAPAAVVKNIKIAVVRASAECDEVGVCVKALTFFDLLHRTLKTTL